MRDRWVWAAIVAIVTATACQGEAASTQGTPVASNPPVAAAQPDPGRVRAAQFIDWAAGALLDPAGQKYAGKPQCEKQLCEADHDVGGGRSYQASWVKDDTKAVRLFSNFGQERVSLACADLKGTLVRKWLYASGTKYHCRINSAVGALIEQYGEDRPSAAPGTSLHVFTQRYVDARPDFRRVLEKQESGRAE